MIRTGNVARRTLQAFFPGLVRPDDAFAAQHLKSAELVLYLKMDVRDRAHACLVARRVLQLDLAADSVTVRAALLHDVGKTLLPYHPLHRIIAHLFTPAGLPREPLAAGLRGAWQLKTHHEMIGADLIRACGGSQRVAELIELLAAPAGTACTAAELLRQADGAT